MGFYWKIELTKNEIAILKASEQYTNRINNLSLDEKAKLYVGPKNRTTNYPAIYDETIGVVTYSMRMSVVASKSLHEDGLLEREGDHWLITARGRSVLELIQQDINKVNN